VTEETSRLENSLADVRQALSEARSPDVRAFLVELMESYEAKLSQRDGGTSGGAGNVDPTP
jgi:metal-sulfur cluster biosynthetic enzyme